MVGTLAQVAVAPQPQRGQQPDLAAVGGGLGALPVELAQAQALAHIGCLHLAEQQHAGGIGGRGIQLLPKAIDGRGRASGGTAQRQPQQPQNND